MPLLSKGGGQLNETVYLYFKYKWQTTLEKKNSISYLNTRSFFQVRAMRSKAGSQITVLYILATKIRWGLCPRVVNQPGTDFPISRTQNSQPVSSKLLSSWWVKYKEDIHRQPTAMGTL